MKAGELFVTLVALVLPLAGCSGSSGPGYPHAKLQGAVLIDGAPVASGRVNFMPAAGTTGVPVSAEIVSGTYQASDVPLGSNTVTFSLTKDTGKMIAEGDRQPYPEIVSIVPPQYAQGFQLNVTGDNSAQDFALTTTEAPR